MTDRDPLLAPFEALIGTWSTEAKHRLVDEVVLGSATFEWLEGGHFLVLSSHNDHELFPDAISVIGRAGGATSPDSTSVPPQRSGLTSSSSSTSSPRLRANGRTI